MKIVVAYDPSTRVIDRTAISTNDIVPVIDGTVLIVPDPEYWRAEFRKEDDLGEAILQLCMVNESETDIEEVEV